MGKFLIYWGVWLVIPLLLEGLVALLSFVRTVRYLFQERGLKPLSVPLWPQVSILVPCYNSAATLAACLNSLLSQSYLELGKVEILILNNGSTDNSFAVFQQVQKSKRHPRAYLYWHDLPVAGKAKALNVGIFQAKGEYILTVDSDTIMHEQAVEKLVRRYLRAGDEVAAVGGSVLIDYRQIDRNSFWLRVLQLAEMYEYLEAFLVGRVAGSMRNSIYTLAGAFSSFRKEKLRRTRLYHQKSIAEDTFLTFEIKEQGKVIFEPQAVIYTEPIASLSKLALQRFRWQRGQMEIAFRYKQKHLGWLPALFNNYIFRTLFMDHTLMFSRTIWLFLLFLLYIWGYPFELFVGANGLIYLMYLLVDLIYLVPILLLLPSARYRRFVLYHSYVILFMPFYRFLLFFVRLQGVIDGILKKPDWRAKTIGEELREAWQELRAWLVLNFRVRIRWK